MLFEISNNSQFRYGSHSRMIPVAPDKHLVGDMGRCGLLCSNQIGTMLVIEQFINIDTVNE